MLKMAEVVHNFVQFLQLAVSVFQAHPSGNPGQRTEWTATVAMWSLPPSSHSSLQVRATNQGPPKNHTKTELPDRGSNANKCHWVVLTAISWQQSSLALAAFILFLLVLDMIVTDLNLQLTKLLIYIWCMNNLTQLQNVPAYSEMILKEDAEEI